MPRLLPSMRGLSETFRRKFLSCRGCFLRCVACQKYSAASFCHVAVASFDAWLVRKFPPQVSFMPRLLPSMRGLSETFHRKFLSCRGCFLRCVACQKEQGRLLSSRESFGISCCNWQRPLTM